MGCFSPAQPKIARYQESLVAQTKRNNYAFSSVVVVTEAKTRNVEWRVKKRCGREEKSSVGYRGRMTATEEKEKLEVGVSYCRSASQVGLPVAQVAMLLPGSPYSLIGHYALMFPERWWMHELSSYPLTGLKHRHTRLCQREQHVARQASARWFLWFSEWLLPDEALPPDWS